MTTEALQDVLSSVWSTCWGCGPQNEHGLRIKSHWDGAEATCSWQAQPYHHAAPGVLNGGVIASIIDCHGIWTAIAATYQHEQRDYASQPPVWYVTGALNITYLRPTPLGAVLLRARVRELGARKAIVDCTLLAGDAECVRGEIVAVRVDPAWLNKFGKI